MFRFINTTILVLVLTLPAVTQAQVNVTIYTSQRYADQFQMVQNRGISKMLSELARRVDPNLKIVTRDCGKISAFYQPRDKTVTICYEYLARADSFFDQNTYLYKGSKETRHTMKLGVFMYVLLHEIGHAAVHLKNIPALGGGEDMADRFATITMLEMTKDNPYRATNMMKGDLIYRWGTQRHIPGTRFLSTLFGQSLYADEHPLTEQRVYNSVCLAYGSNPQLFHKLATWDFRLPQDRRTRCPYEYQQAKEAVKQFFN